MQFTVDSQENSGVVCGNSSQQTGTLGPTHATIFSQPPHNQDIAPCNFLLFPHNKNTQKGKRFEDVENDQT
jgi:hypothetical protein